MDTSIPGTEWLRHFYCRFLFSVCGGAEGLSPDPLLRALYGRAGSNASTGIEGVGRKLLLFCGLGLVGAGATILVVGMTFVFVPQDVAFIGIQPDKLRATSPLLIPVLAHDRAGFGGGLLSVGLLLTMIVRHARLSRSLVEVIALMGFCGFAAALGVHFAIGYTDFVHLSPAYAGFVIFASGTGCWREALAPSALWPHRPEAKP